MKQLSLSRICFSASFTLEFYFFTVLLILPLLLSNHNNDIISLGIPRGFPSLIFTIALAQTTSTRQQQQTKLDIRVIPVFYSKPLLSDYFNAWICNTADFRLFPFDLSRKNVRHFQQSAAAHSVTRNRIQKSRYSSLPSPIFPAVRVSHCNSAIHATPNSGSGAQLSKSKKISRAVRDVLKDQTKKDASVKKDAELRKLLTKEWRVILHNDDIHTFTYVTDMLVNAVPLLTKAKAHTITVEAHRSGLSSIISTWKRRAEVYASELQRNGLTVSIMPDDRFEQNKGSA